jgi:hypothetical protein
LQKMPVIEPAPVPGVGDVTGLVHVRTRAEHGRR